MLFILFTLFAFVFAQDNEPTCTGNGGVEVSCTLEKQADETYFLKLETYSEGLILVNVELTNVQPGEISKLIIGEGITGYQAQIGLYAVKTIEISKYLLDIKKGSFSGFNSLEQIIVDDENPFFGTIDGMLTTKTEGNQAIAFCPQKKQIGTNNDGKLTIGATGSSTENIRVIYDNAFEKQQNLKELTITGNVYSLHSRAFAVCPNLVKVELKSKITSVGSEVFIAEYNFIMGGTPTIENVFIGKDVKMIGKSMFQYQILSTFEFEEGSGLLTIEGHAFDYSKLSGEFTIPNSVVFIMENAFFGTKITKITFGSNLEEICLNAFSNCENLETVVFSTTSKLYRIDESAFSNCGQLTSLTIPSSVLLIGESAFPKTLTSVTFEGNKQPNYCDPTAFGDEPTVVVNVPNDYQQLEFCGASVSKQSSNE